MFIHLTPQYRDETLDVAKVGEALIINGEVFDFSEIVEGCDATFKCDWIAGPVARKDGRIVLTLILPHGEDAPSETLFPKPLDIVDDAKLELPPHTLAPVPKDEELIEPDINA